MPSLDDAYARAKAYTDTQIAALSSYWVDGAETLVLDNQDCSPAQTVDCSSVIGSAEAYVLVEIILPGRKNDRGLKYIALKQKRM